MRVLTAAEMRACDRATSERFGVASLTLMENAGTAVAEFVAENYPLARRVALVCGKGNNGGDGFVAARKLAEAGKQVAVLLLGKPNELAGDAAEMFAKLPVEPLVAATEDELRELESGVFDADVIVDAVLGTGFRPPVSGLYAEAISRINLSDAAVVAVDIPSGAEADSFLPVERGVAGRANAVVTFTAPRPAHIFGRLTDGPTVVAPIGSPDEAAASELNLHLITARDFAALLVPRAPDAHKGDFGHVLVAGGSLGKAGAAAMAGMGALRAGAGLVTVAAPRPVVATVAGFAAELMTEPLEETESGGVSLRAHEYGKMEKLAAGKSVLAIGPGLGRHPETVEFVRTLVQKSALPVVLDADGVNAFEGAAGRLDGSVRPVVLTPHPGEMSRLTGMAAAEIAKDPVGIARRFAQEHRCVLVLKGHRTLVASADGEVWVNATGNAGMAKGGSGDVLTGMLAGLMAQFPERVAECARAAVYLHGLAGDIARDVLTERGMVASDLLAAIGEAFRRAAEQAGGGAVTINP